MGTLLLGKGNSSYTSSRRCWLRLAAKNVTGNASVTTDGTWLGIGGP